MLTCHYRFPKLCVTLVLILFTTPSLTVAALSGDGPRPSYAGNQFVPIGKLYALGAVHSHLVKRRSGCWQTHQSGPRSSQGEGQQDGFAEGRSAAETRNLRPGLQPLFRELLAAATGTSHSRT